MRSCLFTNNSFFSYAADVPKFDLMTERLNEQCIWQEHIRNITVLLSGYPMPSLSWSKGDGSTITAKDSAFKMYLEPYWENGRPDEWMGNLEVRDHKSLASTCQVL